MWANFNSLLETMEEAFVSNAPTFRQTEEATNSAWLWLCTELYKRSYRVESAWCGEVGLKSSDRHWMEFQRQTFKERIVVGSGAGVAKDIQLDFIRKTDGSKLITNNYTTAADYGVSPGQVTPVWRPIRYKRCESVNKAQCQGQDQHLSLAIRKTDEDPFYDLRQECRPPICRVVY